jgi:hypothetical protein
MGEMPVRRRSLLAAAGAVTILGLSGCLSRAAAAVTNTGASPAAVFAGERSDGSDGPLYVGDAFSLSEPSVVRLTPRINAETRGISGSVELEGWVTSTAVVAANYNNTRSNKAGVAAPDFDDVDTDSDGDGVGDGTTGARANYNNTRSNRSTVRPPDIAGDVLTNDDEFVAIAELDEQLQEATAAAWAAISKRSARTGRDSETENEIIEAFDDMEAALAEMRAVLERCSVESCVAALANVADREADLERARGYVESEEWAAFGLGDEAGDDILLGDYLLTPATFDPAGSYSVGERAALYRYLDGEATVAERFTVCLPDAEVPGGNGSIREAVTPQRFLDYMTGSAEPIDGVPLVFEFGAAPDTDGDSGCVVNGATGEVMCWSPHLSAAISGPVSSGGSLGAVRADDGTLVAMSVGSGEDGAPVLVCPAEGEPFAPVALDAWGKKTRGVPPTMDAQGRVLDTMVAQVQVQPEGCPHPFPALFYVGRGLSDGQLIYSGGWVTDDAGLYSDALTALTMAGAAPVVGIGLDDLDSDGDGFGEVVEQKARRTRAYVRYNARGASPTGGTVGELVEVGVLSERSVEGVAWPIRKKPGRKSSEVDMGIHITHLALDAPVLHLTNAEGASNEVKFKAGAELSGQVN